MDIIQNWSQVKETLLEGLDPQKKKIVAPLLENQKDAMLAETAAEGSTRGADIAGFRKILIPMIRRIIPGTIATELVGVQPMTGPVGLVYSMRFKYAEGVAGTDIYGNPRTIAAGSEAFGNDHYGFPSNPIYGFYSGAAGSYSPAGGPAPGASGIGPGTPGDIDGTGATGEYWLDQANDSAFATITNGEFLHRGGHGGQIEGSGGRKMTLEVVSQAVEAGTRKLQAGWTIEAMQDLQAGHGLDIENEMTQALSAQIVQEIDAEIIGDLMALAGTVATFDGSVAATPGYYRPAFVGDRLANLGVIINYVANEIGRKTRRGAGNFIVASPMVVTALQTAAKSVFAPAVQGSFKGPNNTQLVGTLNGNIKIYSYLWNSTVATGVDSVYPYGTPSPGGSGDDSILVGFKGGNGETDAGYFYCPYIPLMSSGTVVNPLTFQPVVSLMTRYGKATFVNNNTSLGNSADYYGKINVTGMSFA